MALIPVQNTFTIGLSPRSSPGNSFSELFSSSIGDAGSARIANFLWRNCFQTKINAVVFHWPDEFLQKMRGKRYVKQQIRFALLRYLKHVRGTKIYWVVNDIWPHTAAQIDYSLARAFVNTLDGAIFLSEHSRQIALNAHPNLVNCRQLVVRHGHYLSSFTHPPTLPSSDRSPLCLLFFGQIQPYKGIETLAELIASSPDRDVRLEILGRWRCEELKSYLETIASKCPSIALNCSYDFLPQDEIELAVDRAHGVVLPYNKILNSGSALFAVSRNRPVLAPRQGSLPELEADIGAPWFSLYDGELSAHRLKQFVDSLRHHKVDRPPALKGYDWAPIGEQLNQFLCESS